MPSTKKSHAEAERFASVINAVSNKFLMLLFFIFLKVLSPLFPFGAVE